MFMAVISFSYVIVFAYNWIKMVVLVVLVWFFNLNAFGILLIRMMFVTVLILIDFIIANNTHFVVVFLKASNEMTAKFYQVPFGNYKII